MLGSKFFSSLPVLPPATFVTEPRPRRPVAPSSSLPDEASSQTAEPGVEPQRPRPSRGSAQLNRWSRARSIRSGRRFDRPAILKDADASPNSRAPSSPPSRSAEALLSIPADEVDGDGEGETALGKAIYMVSDGTGWTAEHSVNAALGQFEHCLVDRGCPVNTHLFSGVIPSPASSLCSASSHSPHPPTQSLKPSQQLKRKTPTSSEFSVLLQSCINARSLQEGRKLHACIREAGFERNRDLLPKLIKLYVVCSRIDIARELFDGIPKRNLDTFIWTAMISGYVKNGTPGGGLMLFCKMLEAGLKPDSHTFSTLLKASTDLGFLQLTLQLHSMAFKYECSSSLSVANSLIYAYGSFGEVHRAQKVFDRLPLRDVVSWSTMIRVCSCTEHYAESLILFTRMQLEERIKPNEVTIVSLLPACGFFSSLRKGQAIHTYIIQNGFETNLFVCSALITMYSRCGDPDGAFTVFNSLGKKNVILWTSMIEGFSLNGRFAKAWELFKAMQEKGIRPTYVTMVVILSACSHGGLVDEGLEIFETMREEFGIEPRVEHFACIVDMLGRKGRLNDAEKFIGMMDMTPTGSVLGPLLGACQVHRNVEIGERLAYKLFELEPTNATNYVILSNIYASVGRWDDVGRLRERMVLKGLSKSPGCSWIEIKEKAYVFGAHATSHLESKNIYKLLKELGDLLINAGYMPSTKFVYLDVEEDDKKKLLCSHSERLAIAFGLLKAPPAVPIRIAKNIRVCGDCHDVIKLISKVTLRQLIIRDTNRFHHFSQGSCSCGDYW